MSANPFPIYSGFEYLSASTKNPMPQAKREYHLDVMRKGLHNIVHADKPSLDDWRVVSDAVNMMETLVVGGYFKDADGLLTDAANAMAEAAAHYRRYGVIRLHDRDIAGVRGVLEDYAQALDALPHRTMVKCHMDTAKRIGAIANGKTRKRDIVVVSI